MYTLLGSKTLQRRAGGTTEEPTVRKREKESVILVRGLPTCFPMAGILHQREPRATVTEEWEQGDEEDAEEKGPISNYLWSSELGRPSIFAHHRPATFYRHSTGVGRGGWSWKFCENWKFRQKMVLPPPPPLEMRCPLRIVHRPLLVSTMKRNDRRQRRFAVTN